MRGMDVTDIPLPIFILEPRSLLERLTDAFGYPCTILNAAKLTDPKERFLAVVKFYLSGWHLKPRGVKKPYWPVLGEFFRCQWKYRDNTQAFYIAEQVCSVSSIPLSVFYYACPEHDLVVSGQLRPSSRFSGNTLMNTLQGHACLYLTHQKEEEKYEMTFPNIYVRGVILGSMFTELGRTITIICSRTDLACELEFKTKVRILL
jgi:oxysterol-binding protein-related protein 8